MPIAFPAIVVPETLFAPSGVSNTFLWRRHVGCNHRRKRLCAQVELIKRHAVELNKKEINTHVYTEKAPNTFCEKTLSAIRDDELSWSGTR